MSTALRNKKVRITPISRPGGWLKPGHDGHFMYTGTFVKLCVPMNATTGKLVDPLEDLTDEEKRQLALKMAIEVEEFNIYSKNNYWIGYEVKRDKEDSLLDLSNPKDLIDYYVLKSNSDTVAPNFTDKYNKGTYRFALVDTDDEIVEKRKVSDKKSQAYRALGKMENSDTRLRNFFKVYGTKKVPADASKDWMVAEIDTIISNDITGFLAIVEDSKYDDKIQIAEAVEVKALYKTSKGTYELPGGKILGTLDETIDFLRDSKNSDVLRTIRARIEASNK